MICPNCGREIDENRYRCPGCGGRILKDIVPEPVPIRDPRARYWKQEPQPEPRPSNVKEFVLREGRGYRIPICFGFACAYLTAAVNVLLALFSRTSAGFALENHVEAVLVFLMGLWLQLTYSRPAAITLFSFAVLDTVISYLVFHDVGGVLILVGGLISLVGACMAKAAYDAFP